MLPISPDHCVTYQPGLYIAAPLTRFRTSELIKIELPEVKISEPVLYPVLFDSFLTDRLKNIVVTLVELGQELAVVTAKFVNDVLIIEILGVSVQETALLSTSPLEMGKNG